MEARRKNKYLWIWKLTHFHISFAPPECAEVELPPRRVLVEVRVTKLVVRSQLAIPHQSQASSRQVNLQDRARGTPWPICRRRRRVLARLLVTRAPRWSDDIRHWTSRVPPNGSGNEFMHWFTIEYRMQYFNRNFTKCISKSSVIVNIKITFFIFFYFSLAAPTAKSLSSIHQPRCRRLSRTWPRIRAFLKSNVQHLMTSCCFTRPSL